MIKKLTIITAILTLLQPVAVIVADTVNELPCIVNVEFSNNDKVGKDSEVPVSRHNRQLYNTWRIYNVSR